MPELRERCFPNLEVVRSDEISLHLLPACVSRKSASLGAGKEIADSMNEERNY